MMGLNDVKAFLALLTKDVSISEQFKHNHLQNRRQQRQKRHTACSSLSEVSKQYQWTSEVRTPSVYQTRHYHPRLEFSHPKVNRDVQMRLMLS